MKLNRAQMMVVFKLLEAEVENARNSGHRPLRGSQALYEKLGKELGLF